MNQISESLQIVFVVAMYLLVIIPLLSYCINAMLDDFVTFLLYRAKRKEQEDNESKRGK